jgi:hypothetical protein
MGFNANTTSQNGGSLQYKPFNISLFWYYIKQIMNVFIRAMVRIFSFGERWNVPFNSAVASLNGTFHLSPHENILTIALINIHYLYTVFGIPCRANWTLQATMTLSAVVLVSSWTSKNPLQWSTSRTKCYFPSSKRSVLTVSQGRNGIECGFNSSRHCASWYTWHVGHFEIKSLTSAFMSGQYNTSRALRRHPCMPNMRSVNLRQYFFSHWCEDY